MDLLGFGFLMMPSCLPLELVVGSGKTEWIHRWTKVSCNRQLYSEPWAICSLGVTGNHMNEVYNHKDTSHLVGMPHMTKTCFSMEICKQMAIAHRNG